MDGRDAGHLAYERTEGLMVLIRTDVDRGFDDSGVADALVRTALTDMTLWPTEPRSLT